MRGKECCCLGLQIVIGDSAAASSSERVTVHMYCVGSI